MELEQLISEVKSVIPKVGYSDRINKIRNLGDLNSGKVDFSYDDYSFTDHSDHSNHSDWDNYRPKPQSNKVMLKLKTITLKTVSDANAHTDHSDHNDFNDYKE